MTTVGTLKNAVAIYYQHADGIVDDRLGWVEACRSGEDRTVYRVGDVVYKIPTRPTANPYDHHAQEEARRRGYRWPRRPAPCGASAITWVMRTSLCWRCRTWKTMARPRTLN